jgi:hypothetical protein
MKSNMKSHHQLAYLIVREGRYVLHPGTSGLRKLAVPDRSSVGLEAGHEVVVGQVVHDTLPADPRRGVAFVRVWHDEKLCQTCRNLREHAAWKARLEEAGRFLQETIGDTGIPWSAPEAFIAAAGRLTDADPAVRAQAQATIRVHADQLRLLCALRRKEAEMIRQADKQEQLRAILAEKARVTKELHKAAAAL